MKCSILCGAAVVALLGGCTYDQYVLRHATMRSDLPLTPVHAGRHRDGGRVELTAAGSGAAPVTHLTTSVGPDGFGPQSEARVQWERLPAAGALQLAINTGGNVRIFGGVLAGTGLGGYGGFTMGLTDRVFEWDFECAVGGLLQRTEGVYAHEWDHYDYEGDSENDSGSTPYRAKEFAFEDRSLAGWSQIGVTVRSKAPGWGGYAEMRFLPRFQLYSFNAGDRHRQNRWIHLSFPTVFGGGVQNTLPSGGRLLTGVRLFQIADQSIPVLNLQYTTSFGASR